MSDTDIRAWALANGVHVPARGPLSNDIRDQYAVATGAEELEPTDADFLIEAGPPPPDLERKPRSIAVPKQRPWQRKTSGKKKPARKRVPIDDTIATVWRALATFARPLPATSRLLKFQAPVAGKILEPIVKDTLIDKVLQPIARTTEGAEAVAVLIGTPALVTAMQLQPQIIPLAMPMLRELMLRMVKIAGPAMAEALKQEHEFEDQYGGSVDDVIGMLFAGVFLDENGVPETPPLDDEDGAIRQVQEAVQNVAAA